MSELAAAAWAKERKAYPRSAYTAGYDRAVGESAKVIAMLIDANVDLFRSFAGDRAPELIVHLVRTLVPERSSSGGDD